MREVTGNRTQPEHVYIYIYTHVDLRNVITKREKYKEIIYFITYCVF